MAAYTSPGLIEANQAYAEAPADDPRKVAASTHWAYYKTGKQCPCSSCENFRNYLKSR